MLLSVHSSCPANPADKKFLSVQKICVSCELDYNQRAPISYLTLTILGLQRSAENIFSYVICKISWCFK